MGFRSTFVTEHYPIQWPQWFIDKYERSVFFPEKHGSICSRFEAKTYMSWSELDVDIQKAINWDELKLDNVVLVYLHECGGITRVQISKDNILYSEPKEWDETECVTHDYCYGCSDIKKINRNNLG